MADAPGSPVAAAERHDPFTPSNVGPNTPGKRAPTAAIWTEKQFLRLLPGGRRSAPLIAKGFTHVCVLRRDSDGKPCNTPLKLTKNKLGGTWLSTKALAHVRIMKYRKIYREQLNEQFQHTVVRDTPPSLTEQETAKGLKEMIDAGFSPAELGMDPVDAAQAYRMALMAQNKSKGAGSSSSAVDVDAD